MRLLRNARARLAEVRGGIAAHLDMPIRAGVVEWHQTALILGVHVSAALQQQLHDLGAVVAGGQVERRRLAPVGGVAVDVEAGEERGHAFFVAAARGVQQLVLAMLARENGAHAAVLRRQVDRG